MPETNAAYQMKKPIYINKNLQTGHSSYRSTGIGPKDHRHTNGIFLSILHSVGNTLMNGTPNGQMSTQAILQKV